MPPAAFVDRDGTLIAEVNYLARPDQVVVLDGVEEALVALRTAGYLIIMISNQAGVARGFFTLEAVHEVNTHLQALLGISLDGIYVCPHHPDGTIPEYAITCDCRKPGDSMLRQALNDLDIDIKGSFIVGDKASDVLAGKGLGIPGYLVATGHAEIAEGYPRFRDFAEVVEGVLNGHPGIVLRTHLLTLSGGKAVKIGRNHT